MEDVELLNKRVLSYLPRDEQAKFEDALHILTKHKEDKQFNLVALEKKGKSVLKVYASHQGGSQAEGATAHEAGGLEKVLYLKEGGKIMLTKNLWTAEGLTNGDKGTVSKVIYPPESDSRNSPGTGRTSHFLFLLWFTSQVIQVRQSGVINKGVNWSQLFPPPTNGKASTLLPAHVTSSHSE